MKEHLNDFRNFLQLQGKSENTISTYYSAVKKYCKWFEQKFGKELKKLIFENLLLYRDALQMENNHKGESLNVKTINLHLNALNSFNYFLIEQGSMNERVVDKKLYLKVQQMQVSPVKFESTEIQQFFQAILEDEMLSKQDQYRNFTLAKLLALTGCRISEALDLKIEDVHLNEREILIRNGKGNKARVVLINKQLHRILSKYLREIRDLYRLGNVSSYLFLSNRSPTLSRKTINKMFTKYSHLANLDKTLSPHDFRHYFCSSCLQNGFSLNEIASLAGHASIKTTLIYTNINRTDMIAKLDEID